METHTIRFSEGTWRRVQAIARREGIAASEWVRRQAELGLERAEGRHQLDDLFAEVVEQRRRLERIEQALARRGR